jgi:type III pantothenate kinase
VNIIAIDIGNTNITIGLFLEGDEKFVKSVPGKDQGRLTELLKSAWQMIPVAKGSKEKKRDGVIVVSSVKPDRTEMIQQVAEEDLGEKVYIVGKDIPLPISLWVDEPGKVGTDRVVAAAAAYEVVEDAVVVADLGTAMTIDLVDQHGVFQGGVICPGIEMGAEALQRSAAQLPKVTVSRPQGPYGKNTSDAINCGLYYSAVSTLQEVTRRYAEKIGRWPHTVLTGSAAELIKDDCEFIDSYVPDLVVKGIVLAYQKYIEDKNESL